MTTIDGDDDGSPRALIAVTPEMQRRLRDPRIVLAIVLAIIGGIALIAGYWGVSGTLDPGKQLPYIISGGIGGLFCLGAAAALLFVSDLGETRREVREVKDLLETVSRDLADLKAATAEQATENGTKPVRRRARAAQGDG